MSYTVARNVTDLYLFNTCAICQVLEMFDPDWPVVFYYWSDGWLEVWRGDTYVLGEQL